MATFKVLNLIELLMVWLRIYPNPLTANSTPTNDFFRSVTPYYISIHILGFIAATAVFLNQNKSDVVTALPTAMVILGSSQALGMFLCVGCKIDKVKLLHQKLQAIVDQAAEDGHYNIVRMYWETEQKCFRYTKFMLYYICGHQMPCVAALSYAIYCICRHDFDTSTWNLPFTLAVPFDTQSVFGWLLKWLFELNCGFAYILGMIIPTAYFFCFCLYIVAICNHFNALVESIHLNAEQIRSCAIDRSKYFSLWIDVRDNILQLIGVHLNVLEVFDLVRSAMTGTIFSLLPVNSVVLGLSMYTMEHSEFDVVETVIRMIFVICALIWCTLFCYFGDMASNRLSSIGFAVYAANWYGYPVEWQRFIVLMILRSDKPAYFHGLNVINCSLEVFGKLCKSACSYYVVFRNFSKI